MVSDAYLAYFLPHIITISLGIILSLLFEGYARWQQGQAERKLVALDGDKGSLQMKLQELIGAELFEGIRCVFEIEREKSIDHIKGLEVAINRTKKLNKVMYDQLEYSKGIWELCSRFVWCAVCREKGHREPMQSFQPGYMDLPRISMPSLADDEDGENDANDVVSSVVETYMIQKQKADLAEHNFYSKIMCFNGCTHRNGRIMEIMREKTEAAELKYYEAFRRVELQRSKSLTQISPDKGGPYPKFFPDVVEEQEKKRRKLYKTILIWAMTINPSSVYTRSLFNHHIR
jgi:hypothetical protein